MQVGVVIEEPFPMLALDELCNLVHNGIQEAVVMYKGLIVFALRGAGNLAESATAYGGVGMVDPNPIVASKGVDKLRESGVDVTVGVEEELCEKLIEAYIHRMLTGKPFLTLSGEGLKEAVGNPVRKLLCAAFFQASSGRFVPGAVLMDLESGTKDSVRSGTEGAGFDDSVLDVV
ncbi:hypothetical protein HHK36_027729 [Tetracentron sinense]|uniref:Uncharacterized protein n=1 Tax=Tetracentron sinense TaxID=13715 RepID=A0A835D3T5_TETSI|nr:hypothetical protein HHK36_027729 [Tetracentron sinense]